MKYCLAIDVAKGKSMVGLIKEGGEILIQFYEVMHSKKELLKLHKGILDLNLENKVAVIIESTSIYHLGIFKFFKDLNYEMILLNPIISKKNKMNLRKTKTDKTDCLNLANIYFKNEYNKQIVIPEKYLYLQDINRQIYTLNESLVRYKNRFRQLIERVFPEYEIIFKGASIFDKPALLLIKKLPHANLIANKRVDAIANILSSVYNRHPGHYRKKAEKIKEMALNSLTSADEFSMVVENVRQQATLILNLANEINKLKEILIIKAKQIDIFLNIKSIYGIGDYTAALILAEVKDPRRFTSIKKLYASCGLDPTIIQSGKSVNYNGPISKRGNRHSRKILFNAVINIITASSKSTNLDNPILVYYRKKRNEGKHHYASVIACTTKLLRIIYTLCINNNFYNNSL